MSHKKSKTPTNQPAAHAPDTIAVAASMAQAAGLLGLELPAVQEAKRTGCPAFRGNGTVHMATLGAWLANHKPTAPTPESKADANRREAIARANEREIRVAERLKNLIPDYIMRRAFTSAIVAFKTRMLAIPNNVALRIGVMTDPVEIREFLRNEIHEALEELSRCEWSKAERADSAK